MFEVKKRSLVILLSLLVGTKVFSRPTLEEKLSESTFGSIVDTHKYVMGMNLDSNDSDEAILIELKSSNDSSWESPKNNEFEKTGFILVSKKQKFYQANNFYYLGLEFLNKKKENDLQILQEHLDLSVMEAKYLEPGLTIKGINNIDLTVVKTTKIKLQKPLNGYSIFGKNRFTFFVIDHNDFIKDEPLLFSKKNLILSSIFGLLCAGYGAISAMVTNKTSEGVSIKKSWNSLFYGIFGILFYPMVLLTDKYMQKRIELLNPTKIPNGSENFAVVKTDFQLGDIIQKLTNYYYINFAKIEAVGKDEKINTEELDYYEEILCDKNGEPISLENGSNIRLLIAL